MESALYKSSTLSSIHPLKLLISPVGPRTARGSRVWAGRGASLALDSTQKDRLVSWNVFEDLNVIVAFSPFLLGQRLWSSPVL